MDPGRGERLPDRARRHRQVPHPRRPRHRRRRGRAPGPLLHRRRPGRDPLPRHWPTTPSAEVIDTLLRNDLVICRRTRLRPAGRHRRPTAVPVRRRRLRTPLPRHRLALALRVLGPVPARTHHRRQHARPAPAPLPHRRHRRRLLPDETSPSDEEGPTSRPADQPRRVGTFSWPPAGTTTWPLTHRGWLTPVVEGRRAMTTMPPNLPPPQWPPSNAPAPPPGRVLSASGAGPSKEGLVPPGKGFWRQLPVGRIGIGASGNSGKTVTNTTALEPGATTTLTATAPGSSSTASTAKVTAKHARHQAHDGYRIVRRRRDIPRPRRREAWHVPVRQARFRQLLLGSVQGPRRPPVVSIANDNSQGQSVVTIKKTDKAFKTSGCGTWTRVD